jgi:hypothetical protein
LPAKDVLALLKPDIEKTITALEAKKFRVDPLAGKKYSKVVSVLSSAYKRHGFILERAILEAVKENPDLVVWHDPVFHVSTSADHMVDTIILTPDAAFSTEMPYGAGHRTLQVDLIVFDKKNEHVTSYEIKRGNGLHDAGKKRSILRDLLCQQVLLKSYAASKGYTAKTARVHIIFYYGQCSIKKPFSLIDTELDKHFNWPVLEAVEKVNRAFRKRLTQMLDQ